MLKTEERLSPKKSEGGPTVTIAIPTLSRIGYLKEAVESALRQDYSNLEVCIGDDGTSEQISSWARDACRIEKRIHYCRNACRLGLSGNWNALAERAEGEFIVIIGDDDRLLPNFVSDLLMLVDRSTDVAFCNHYVINSSGCRMNEVTDDWDRRYGRSVLAAGTMVDPEITAWSNSIAISAALIRTERIRQLRFKEDLNNPELEFFIRLAKQKRRFVFTPKYLCEYRVHNTSETSRGLKSERLVKYLLEEEASRSAEKQKMMTVAPLIADAVGRYICDGNLTEAKVLFKNKYFSDHDRRSWKGRFQKGLLYLPSSVAAVSYRLVRWMLRSLRYSSLTGYQERCESLPRKPNL
jgi:glycosyltransferase involved in cell wall biosynthesis